MGFVDNDDTVDIDFYEKLYSQAYKTSADIVKGEAHIFDYSGRDYFDNLNKAIRENNSKLFFHNYWWTAIYKTLLIKNNNIKFLEGYPLGGDVLFLNQVILLANNISLVDNIYYNYYRREESGDSKVLSLDKIKSVLEIHLKIIENTNKYITSINKIGVLNIYKWCLECGLNYAYRRKTFENLEYCINRTFDMYDKCIFKNELYNILKINYPIESNFIKNGKKNELIDYFKKYNTPQKKILATLRKSHNKVLKYE